MDTLVRITAQYHDGNGKPKGGQEFEMRADVDLFMYMSREDIASILQRMINEETKNHEGTHTYVDHELIFSEPIMLSSTDFEKEIELEWLRAKNEAASTEANND